MIEIEVAALTVVVLVGVVLMVLGHRGLTGRLYDRQKAMDAHTKAVTRNALDVTSRADYALKEAQQARDDARQILEQVERHMSDPRVKRILES